MSGTDIGAILIGLATLVTAWRTTRKVDGVSSALAENTTISRTLVKEVEKVHDTTNSNLSTVKADLAIAVDRVTALVAIVEGLKAELAAVRGGGTR